MNKVDVNAEDVPLPTWASKAAAYCQLVMDTIGMDGRELSLLFCDNRLIRKLNCKFRALDCPTDVLSFPYTALAGEFDGGTGLAPAGDIVISLEEMRANAGEAGVGADEELRRLLIHGILHLSGHDHAGNGSGEPMLIYQEALLKELPPWKMTL